MMLKNECAGREWKKQAFKELSLSIREYGILTGADSKKELKVCLEPYYGYLAL